MKLIGYVDTSIINRVNELYRTLPILSFAIRIRFDKIRIIARVVPTPEYAYQMTCERLESALRTKEGTFKATLICKRASLWDLWLTMRLASVKV